MKKSPHALGMALRVWLGILVTLTCAYSVIKPFGNQEEQDGYSYILQPHIRYRLLAIVVDDEGEKIIGAINQVASNTPTTEPQMLADTFPDDTVSFVFSKLGSLGASVNVLKPLLTSLNTKGLALGFNWDNVDSVVFFYKGITIECIEIIPLQQYLKQITLLPDYCTGGGINKKHALSVISEVNRASDYRITWYHSKGWGGNVNIDAFKQLLGLSIAGVDRQVDCTIFSHHDPSGTGIAFRYKNSPVFVMGCTISPIINPFGYFKALTAERLFLTAEAAIEDTLMKARSLSPLFSDLVPNLVITEEGSLYIVLPPGSIVEE